MNKEVTMISRILYFSLFFLLGLPKISYGQSFDKILGPQSYLVLGSLLLVGFLGLVFLIFSKNRSISFLLSLIAFGTFFKLQANGVASHSELLTYSNSSIFILGIALLLVEIIVPGFTIFGIAGLGFMIFSILTSFSNIYYGLLVLFFVVSILFFTIKKLISKGYRSDFIDRLRLTKSFTKEAGFSSGLDLTAFENKKGQALSDLRPTGKAKFGDEIVDVISEASYIEKASRIKVIKVVGSKIIVREENENE